MYGIFTYVWHKSMVNVGKYTIHGAYGRGLIHDEGQLSTLCHLCCSIQVLVSKYDQDKGTPAVILGKMVQFEEHVQMVETTNSRYRCAQSTMSPDVAPKSELAPGRTGDQIDMNTMCLSEKEFMATWWFQGFLDV